jgi:hypothetical protein
MDNMFVAFTMVQQQIMTGLSTPAKQASSSLLLAFASMVILGVEPHRDP